MKTFKQFLTESKTDNVINTLMKNGDLFFGYGNSQEDITDLYKNLKKGNKYTVVLAINDYDRGTTTSKFVISAIDDFDALLSVCNEIYEGEVEFDVLSKLFKKACDEYLKGNINRAVEILSSEMIKKYSKPNIEEGIYKMICKSKTVYYNDYYDDLFYIIP